MNDFSNGVISDGEGRYFSLEEMEKLNPGLTDYITEQYAAGREGLKAVEKDISNLISLTTTLHTQHSLKYALKRLRETPIDYTIRWFLETELMTTAFINTYARLFNSGKGAGIAKKALPAHLRDVHDEIMNLRNERFAHNGKHDSLKNQAIIGYENNTYDLTLRSNIGLYVSGKDEWEELVTFIDGYLHDRLHKNIKRLKEKTGSDWKITTTGMDNAAFTTHQVE